MVCLKDDFHVNSFYLMKKGTALIIFAKAPIPGRVKTRLQPYLSPNGCAKLQASFILDTVMLAQEVKGAEILLACHPGIEDPFLKEVSDYFGIRPFRQVGKTLGERISNAVKYVLKIGYGKAVIIGSDSPDLPAGYISKAFVQLDLKDMVLGPSRDGGYYLIGMKEELPIFDNIPWSTDKVFEMTVKKAEERGITFSILQEWYDIDTWKDLQRFRASKSRKTFS